jgi:hypothetical protein
MVDQLIEIIGREAALFESFLGLLEKQQEMLVNNDLEGLNEVTNRQREKLVECQLLNKRREELVLAIKGAQSISGDLNVSRLLDLVDKDRADRLVKLRAVIFGLNEKINEVRNQNALLLTRSREYISRTLDMLSKLNHPETTYSAAGMTEQGRSNLAVNRRA